MAESLYTLGQIAALTGEMPYLISFLVRDRCIPTRSVGNAIVIDDAGFSRIRREIAEFNSKRPRRRKRASAGTR